MCRHHLRHVGADVGGLFTRPAQFALKLEVSLVKSTWRFLGRTWVVKGEWCEGGMAGTKQNNLGSLFAMKGKK